MRVQAALGLFLAYLVAERLYELWISSAHTRRLRERGAVEYGSGHFPLLVVLHTLFPLALTAEVLLGGARPGRYAWGFFALFFAAQVLRVLAMWTLGEHWNVRILVVPGTMPVRRGIYRWLRHPNYLAVAIELAAAPLMFGAWRTALGASLVNAIAIAIRIPVEDRALAEAARSARV